MSLDDLKQCILTGGMVEQQFDEVYDEYKYVIEGETLEVEDFIHIIAKLGKRNTRSLQLIEYREIYESENR